MRRSQPHRYYREENRFSIETRFKQIGFNGEYSYDLVKDIANAYTFELEGEDRSNSFLEVESEYDKNIQNFIKGLDFSKFSGFSPLEKAASIITLLSNQEGGEGEEGDGEPLPIFNKGEEGIEKALKKLEEDVNKIIETNQSGAKYLSEKGKIDETEFINLSDSDKEVLENISIVGKFGKIKSQKTLSSFKVSLMEEYSQIASINSMSSMLMPTFGYKLATKQVLIKKPRQESKQSLILLIDDSRSMDVDEKRNWIKAILFDRYKAVEDGKAELFIILFESDADMENVICINSKKSIDLTWFPELDGGSTNVERAIKTVENGITSGKLGNHLLKGTNPQIVIVNDGQDTVNPFKTKYPTHAFILGQDNKGLEKTILDSGGIYKRFL